jgi:hypothetical protein
MEEPAVFRLCKERGRLGSLARQDAQCGAGAPLACYSALLTSSSAFDQRCMVTVKQVFRVGRQQAQLQRSTANASIYICAPALGDFCSTFGRTTP